MTQVHEALIGIGCLVVLLFIFLGNGIMELWLLRKRPDPKRDEPGDP